MRELQQAENRCIEFCQRTIEWLDVFYVSASKKYRIAYTAGDRVATTEEPNAACSTIACTVKDCEKLTWSARELRGWELLSNRICEMSAGLLQDDPVKLLPLRTFGALPLFSVSYLGQCLAEVPDALKSSVLAVIFRRILLALTPVENDPILSGKSSAPLHPFVLYRIVRALEAIKNAYDIGSNEAPEIANEFMSLIQRDNLLAELVGNNIPENELQDLYGLSQAKDRRRTARHRIISDSLTKAIDRCLKSIEDSALAAVQAELAKGGKTIGSSFDSSSVAFALAILGHINRTRHQTLISQGLRLILETANNGIFPAGLPFHIDVKGRALVVPSVEIANVLLETFLRGIEMASDEEIDLVFRTTSRTQDYYVESYGRVELAGRDQPIYGWCSDRAASPNRLDSWITAQVLGFFVNRLNLIRWAKRRRVFANYSWMPHALCRPDWKDVVESDLGSEGQGVKERIREIVDKDPATRDIAPVFLLYGPPGTSKTTVIQALAREKRWDLIMLSPSDFIAESLDHIEQRARSIFEDLLNIDNCVVLMDEMDAMFRDRQLVLQKSPGTVIEFVIPALLPKLQQLRDYALRRHMAVFFVTNYYETIDRAISRAGRIDTHLLMLPYTKTARRRVAGQLLFRDQEALLPPSLETLLGDFPCNLVFRDIKNLIARTATGPMGPAPANASVELGLLPEIYDPRTRKAAFREVCAFLSRLHDEKHSWERYLGYSEQQAADYLYRLPKLPTHHEIWNRLAREWAQTLGGA